MSMRPAAVYLADPGIVGVLQVAARPDAIEWWGECRPGLDDDTRDQFAQWAGQTLTRFAELGPDPDDWGHGVDDHGRQVWQLRCRLVPGDD